MLCRELALVKDSADRVEVKPLPCGCWSCELCVGHRLITLKVLARSGKPTTFLTLTVNPAVGSSPLHRRKMLTAAWATLLKRITRKLNGHRPEYLWVIEKTKRGEPHMHVLLRMPFLAQQWISDQMRDLIGAQIVHIRRVDSEQAAAAYVAKYISKEPGAFGTGKRYFASRGWNLGEPDGSEDGWIGDGWRFAGKGVLFSEFVQQHVSQGHWPQVMPDGVTRLWKPGYWSSGPDGRAVLP